MSKIKALQDLTKEELINLAHEQQKILKLVLEEVYYQSKTWGIFKSKIEELNKL